MPGSARPDGKPVSECSGSPSTPPEDDIRVPRWCWEYIQDLNLVSELPLWKRHLLAAQIWRQVEPRLCGACLERAHQFPEASGA